MVRTDSHLKCQSENSFVIYRRGKKKRRRRQQLRIDLGEENELDNNALWEQSTHMDSRNSSNGQNDETCVTQVDVTKMKNSHNSSGTTPAPQDTVLENPTCRLPEIPDVYNISKENLKPQVEPRPAEPSTSMYANRACYEEAKTDEEFSLSSELAQWALECYVPHVTINRLLRLLRKAGHVELPMDARTIMNTPRQSSLMDFSKGCYIHYGLENALLQQLGNTNITSLASEIQLDINVDGLPLAKSSQSSLWPILGRIVHPGFHTPFVIGAYHYNAKPSSVEEFLTPFVREYVHLHNNGFYYEGTKYIPTIRAVICDSPARCFVTCTKQYNGYYGCPKCTTEGTYLRFVTFLDLDAPLRTDVDFRNRCQEEHHTGTSPFEAAALKMVSQFPLDYMHVILLGVMKKLLLLWLTGRRILSALARKKLTKLLKMLRKWMPREFSRKPRGTDEVKMWKATEFRLFLLYIGPSVLRNLHPEPYLRHFIALSCACRILCDPHDCVRNNNTAKDLLVWFVRRFVSLYGAEEMVSNVHNLIHINEDVKLYGPLDAFSAFPFENFMQKLKRLLRSSVNPLQQLHRRLTEMMAHVKPFNDYPEGPVFIKGIAENLPLGCHRSHMAIKFKGFYLSMKKPNNCCYTNDGSIVVVQHIGYRNKEPVIIGRKFERLARIPLYPFDSRLIDMCLASKLSALSVWPISEVTKKAVMFPNTKTQFNVMPLLHGFGE